MHKVRDKWVVVQVGAVKIYVALAAGVGDAQETGWNSVYHTKKFGAFFEFHPPWMLM